MRSCSTWPGTRFCGLNSICGKIAWRAPQRLLHPVTDLHITPVQCFARDGGEDIGHERVARRGDLRVERLEADRDVPDRATYGVAQCVRHFGETHQARAGHFVELARVALFRDRGHDNVGNVIYVDDRLYDIAAGHPQDPGQDWISQVAFGIVLREPGRADDGETHARVAHHLLAQ